MEERVLTISRKKTEYLGCNEHQDAEIRLHAETVERVKTSYLGSTLVEDRELNADRSHPQSSELMEELEESVWSVVRQENEREDQAEGVQDSGQTDTGARGRDMGIEEGTRKEIGGRRSVNATMDMRSHKARQDKK